MAITVGDTVTATDIFNKFASAIASNANSGIVYGTNNYHFSDLDAAGIAGYGGTTSGLTQSSSGINSGDTITASTITNYIASQAAAYCRIRNVAVTRNVTGGSSSTVTGITHLRSDLAATFTTPSTTGVEVGNTIAASSLNDFYTNCYNNYLTARNSTYNYSYTVCHVSCHSSCHGSRGRR